MSQRFSHLVWLGAGTATEPENLFDLAEQLTLFEARESACQALQKKFPQENISVRKLVLTTKNVPVNFTEYNLAEFSAIQAVTGLKNLFPGLNAVNSEQVTGTAITDAISALALKDNNLLIVDIADSNLALLEMLEQQKQLIHFSEIYIQAASEPLYADAATTIEITSFLQANGYLLQQTSWHDPDLPWLSFSLNPLWQKLQQAEHGKVDAAKQLDLIKQQLAAEKQQAEHAKADAAKQLDAIKQQLVAEKQQATQATEQLEQSKAELVPLHEHCEALAAAKAHAENVKEQLQQQLAEKEKAASRLQQAHESLKKQQAEQVQQLGAVQQQLSEKEQALTKQKEELNKQKDECKKLIQLQEQLSKELQQQKKAGSEKKYNGDAQIDDFLSDISPFFYGKRITYVDIGAYIGEVFDKIITSKKLSIREAHLYEPNPVSFEQLKANLAETKLNSIHLNNFALGEAEKTSKFITANAMTKITNDDSERESTTGIFSSEIKTLGSQINKITEKHIHLLKIDVEGYEMEVLAGAEEILKSGGVDIIYIEVGFNKAGTQQTYMGKIDSFLQNIGYRVFKIYEQRNEWIEDSPLLRRCNFAYMSESFSRSNPYKLTKTIAELKAEIRQLQQKEKN